MARYNVLDRETAISFGIKCEGEYNQHVLVTMNNNNVVDDVVCFGFKRENLQAIADKRNEELLSVKQKLSSDMEYLQ